MDNSRPPVCGRLVGTGGGVQESVLSYNHFPVHVCVFDQVWLQGRMPALPTCCC